MLKGKSPQRIILTSDGKLPLDSNIVKSAREIKTIVATTNKINNADRVTLESYGIEVIILKEEKYKSWRGVDLNNLLEELGKRKITSILIEGGSRVNYSFLNSGLVDKIIFLTTPFVLGNPPYAPLVAKRMASLMKLEFLKSYKIGEDIVIESYLPSKK
jgi:diaminohydroxyphosphoribosylaminopyrimidine deaminase/5-amino-6-(5-phosphoribosylamino)uracil reductase